MRRVDHSGHADCKLWLWYDVDGMFGWMLMKKSKFSISKFKFSRGFTLVELLVVIVIVAVLAALGVVGIQRARESAFMASNITNLRSLGGVLLTVQEGNGALPLGYNWSTGESWATLVVAEATSGNAKQDRIVLAPTVARDIPPQLNHETISNYAVNPIIFPDNISEGGTSTIKYRMSPLRLTRPNEQIFLGDSLPRSATAKHGHSMIVWWGLRGGPSGNSWSNPPVANPSSSERPISLPKGIEDLKVDSGSGLPAFRNRGKGHFLFADGHVEALAPSQLKQKHFAVSY